MLGTIASGTPVTIVVQAPSLNWFPDERGCGFRDEHPGGPVTVQASVAVGNAVVDIPFLDPKMLVLVTLLLLWVGLRRAKGAS